MQSLSSNPNNSNELNDSIKDLYQEVILEHNRYPKNFKSLPDATHSCEGYNPLCGDQVTVYVKTNVNNQEIIEDVSFEAQSCAICKASCSIMTEIAKGKSISEFKEVFNRFHLMATGKLTDKAEIDQLGKLEIFSNISRYPTRVKCATLGWHTLMDAITGKGKTNGCRRNE